MLAGYSDTTQEELLQQYDTSIIEQGLDLVADGLERVERYMTSLFVATVVRKLMEGSRNFLVDKPADERC